ncbi:MAG TPA: serine/threonine-protein kinase, partial [Polyangiaceae bacterium]|nr:serine/threonine-protein kinase [Polyangiaceae bacterium]
RATRDAADDVALKLMFAELAEDAEALQMFLDEQQIASQVDHQNVARVLDTGMHRGSPFIVQELVDGYSYVQLGEAAQSAGVPLPVGLHLHVLSRAAQGLHGAHETRGADGTFLSIVHRDVKPQNVLIAFDGRVKVVDFGIAAAHGRKTRTATGNTKGTLAYLAPEQILSPRNVDRRADIWALGVIAWEALSGERLFQDANEGGTIWNVVHRAVPELTARALPPVATRTLNKCLQRDRNQRYPSAAAVAEGFEEAAAECGWSASAQVAAQLQAIAASVS